MEDGFARINCYATDYSRIALINYAKAKEKLHHINNNNIMEEDRIIIEEQFSHNVLISVTFAAMAIEAFLNDYIARRLGDDFYYNNFDNLNPLAKLQLIAEFIFNERLLRDREPYQAVNVLFKKRNEYVHNKSKNYFDVKEEQLKKQIIESYPNEMIKSSKNAIKALYDIAKYFERNDDSSAAMFRLMCRYVGFSYSEKDEEMIKKVQKEFGVKPMEI